MDVHLRDLRYFAAVAEELSFTRAAERLHLSQPALSKQIAGLETALRARLLRRDRRRVELTAAGAALYSAASRLLAEWDEAVDVVAEAAAAEAQVLRVGTLTSLGRSLFPAALQHFDKRQPGWQVVLNSFGWGDPAAGLASQETDAAFVWLPTGLDEIDTQVLVTERRLVAMASTHPLARRDQVSLAELEEEAFAALPAAAGPARDFWLATEERGGRQPRIAAEVTSADEVFELVSTGAAVVLLAEGNAAVYARPGITCIPVAGLGPARLAVAWRRGDHRVQVADFVRACRDAADRSRPNL